MVLTVKQVAAQLQCSKDQVYELIYSGRLHASDISANPGKTRASYRVPEKALERFLAQSTR